MLTTHNVPYALQHINDVLPCHKSWPNIESCSASLYVCISHLLYQSDLFHEQAGTRSGKTCPCAGNRQILTWAAPADDVHGRQLRAIQLCDVTHMDHTWKALLRDLNGKGFNLRSPHRRNAAANGSQRKTTDAVKQASHSEPAHFDTACTIVRVVFTAACAVYTALIMLALVVVSRPNAPAMRGISPAESMRPSPNRA